VAAKKWGEGSSRGVASGMEGANRMGRKASTGPPGKAVPKALPLEWKGRRAWKLRLPPGTPVFSADRPRPQLFNVCLTVIWLCVKLNC
jgi:hypothetical protein